MNKPMENPIIEFTHALQAYGLVVSQVIDDGVIHKCKCAHDKGGKTSGRYFLHSDGKANGKFGCYHDHDNALGCTWESNMPDVRTDAEKAAAKDQQAIQAAKREAQLQAERDEAAIECKRLWDMAHDADRSHAYLANKGVQAYGVKALNGALCVPVYDGKNAIENLVSVQFIQPDGSKRFKTGGKKQGGYFSFGSMDTQTVVICEGYSTGASIAEATGHRVVVAFDVGNLKPVSQRIASTLPDDWTMIIAADNDAYGVENKGLTQATAAAQSTGALLAVPCFDGVDVSTQPTDFNDLHQLAGVEAVKAAFALENLIKPMVMQGDGEVSSLTTPIEETDEPYKPTSHNQADGVPYGYVVNDGGVWFTDEKEVSLRVCNRLDVVAMTRNNSSESWGRLLRWHDADNKPHQWAMPIELSYGLSADVSKELARQGLIISPNGRATAKLNDYIVGSQPTTRARCVNKTGWHNNAFVLPDQTIGQSEEIAIYQTNDSMANPYAQSGTLDEWRDNVAARCAGNSRCVLAVSMAFAGVLLPLAGLEGGGVHIVGSSSTGKSTVSRLAASVYGGEKFVRQWRVTDNGLEGIASLHNHGLLILDELRQAPSRDVGNIVYMLANGAGKVRAGRSGGGKQSKAWELLYLSNGEIGLSQHMGEAGKQTHAGQETRFIEIKADAGAGLGIFEVLNGCTTGAGLSDAIKTATARHYGVAGIAFIQQCTHNAQTLRGHLKADIEAFVDHVVSAGSEGQAVRVAQRLGLIGVAGELATAWGITGWERGEAMRAAEVCFNNWMDNRASGGANSEKANMLEAVQTFIMKHADSRFTNLDEIRDEKIVNRAGWKRKGSDGLIEYSIIPDVFKKEVCAGFDYGAVAKYLGELGLIKTSTSGGKKRYATHQRIDSSTMLVYRINGGIFDSDRQEAEVETSKTLDPLKSGVNSVNSVNTRPKPSILGALEVNTSSEELLTPKNGVLTVNRNGVNRETPINSGFAAGVNTVNTVNTKKTHTLMLDESAGDPPPPPPFNHEDIEATNNPFDDELSAYKNAFDSVEVSTERVEL